MLRILGCARIKQEIHWYRTCVLPFRVVGRKNVVEPPPDAAFVTYNSGKEANSRPARRRSDMLVLSRKLGEKICIGENICITVVDIDRGKIRLGIEAPRDVPVFRQELLPLKTTNANTAAAPAIPQ